VDELIEGDPATVALENARRKAAAVEGELVLGVDTIVVLDGRIYGKPTDAAEAAQTLAALSGQVHTVLSGVCARSGGREQSAVASTDVRFRALDEPLIDWYLRSQEWRDRAGGYAIQGRGAALVAAIEGDYWNVVGLPVAALLEILPGLLRA
jgi:septum formation protein